MPPSLTADERRQIRTDMAGPHPSAGAWSPVVVQLLDQVDALEAGARADERTAAVLDKQWQRLADLLLSDAEQELEGPWKRIVERVAALTARPAVETEPWGYVLRDNEGVLHGPYRSIDLANDRAAAWNANRSMQLYAPFTIVPLYAAVAEAPSPQDDSDELPQDDAAGDPSRVVFGQAAL